MSKLRTRDLLRTSLRLTLLQSTWCEGGMQSIGLAYCLIPGFTRIHGDPKTVQEALKRFEEPFNTHPFLVGVVAGALLKLEEEGRSYREILAFLRNTGPLGAIADPFFRSALPCFVSIVSVLVALLLGPVAAILTLIFLFNTVHLWVRLQGILVGYQEGIGVLPRVARWLSPRRTWTLKTIAAVCAGATLVVFLLKYGSAAVPWQGALIMIATALVALLLSKWQSSHVFVIPASLACIILVEVLV